MNIIGPDALIFGVDDVAAATQYLTDYGLTPVNANSAGGRFEALDGTAIVIAHKDDPQLPAALASGNALRKTVYGVADAATVDRALSNAVAAQPGWDRLPAASRASRSCL